LFRRGEVPALRHFRAYVRVPKLGTVEWAHPCAFYHTDKTVLALDGGFVAVRPRIKTFATVFANPSNVGRYI